MSGNNILNDPLVRFAAFTAEGVPEHRREAFRRVIHEFMATIGPEDAPAAPARTPPLGARERATYMGLRVLRGGRDT